MEKARCCCDKGAIAPEGICVEGLTKVPLTIKKQAMAGATQRTTAENPNGSL